MSRKTTWTILLLASLSMAGGAHASEPVREFHGSRSTETLEFEVRAPWILDWRMVTDFPGQMAVDISLLEAGTGIYQGSVLKTKWPGNGVRLFNEGGKFRFKVHSNLAEWTLKVEQLTREEAEQYTPKAR